MTNENKFEISITTQDGVTWELNHCGERSQHISPERAELALRDWIRERKARR
jgi:hypothetical protein